MRVWPFSRSVPKVAVLRLSGVIAASGRPVSGGLSVASLDQSIRRAFSMRGVTAIALSINPDTIAPAPAASTALNGNGKFVNILAICSATAFIPADLTTDFIASSAEPLCFA